MVKKNTLLGLFLCLLGIMPSALALNNDMNNCLQAIYANDEQGIMPADGQQRDLDINLLKDHVEMLKKEATTLQASTTAGRYEMAADIADLICGTTAIGFGAILLVNIYRAKLPLFKSLGYFIGNASRAVLDVVIDPSLLWQGYGSLCISAKEYRFIAGVPLIIAASAIGSKMLYRKANRCAQERDERLQEIEKEIVRDYEIIGRLKAVSYMYIC